MADTNQRASKKPGLFGKLTCKHDLVKRENWHQPDRSSGKVAYKCSICGKIVKKAATRY